MAHAIALDGDVHRPVAARAAPSIGIAPTRLRSPWVPPGQPDSPTPHRAVRPLPRGDSDWKTALFADTTRAPSVNAPGLTGAAFTSVTMGDFPVPRFTPTPKKWRRAVRISTVTALKSCLFAGPGELPHTGSRAVVFSRRPGRADHRLMRNSCVPHPFPRLNPLGDSGARRDRTGGGVGRLWSQRPNPRRIGLRAYRAMSDLERFATPGARHSAPGIWTEHKSVQSSWGLKEGVRSGDVARYFAVARRSRDRRRSAR